MAEAQFNYTVGYSIDKKSYDQLIDSLKRISATANNPDTGIGKALEKQLKEAGAAAEKLKSIMERSWDSKLNQLNLTTVNNEFKKAGLTAGNFYNILSKGQTAGIEGANQFARLILNTNIQLKQSNQLLDKMAVTFKNTIRYGISSSAYNTMANSIQKAYNYTKNLDTSLNDIRIVSGKSAEQMEQFAVSANKAAQSLGKTTLDYTKAATIYFQQGLSPEEVEKRTEVTLKAANVTGQSAQEVSEQLTAVWNGYKVANDELELYVDKLAAVAAHSASNLEELSTGLSKVASAANIMGVDIDQLTAQMSTIISVTRQAPESVGTALRTIYARIADIKAGLDDETSLGNYSGKMAKLGINVLDASGNLRDMGKVIEEIGGKWTDLDREQQIALARTMAGTRQYNNLLTLFDNWDKYIDALETSSTAAGTLQNQQEIYMESTEAHLQQMQAEAEKLYSTLFNQEAARGFFDLVKEGLNVLNNYVTGLGGGMGTLIGLGSQLANIFSGQIAGTINKSLVNLETRVQQQDTVAVKENLIKQVKDAHAVEGYSIGEAGLEKEVTYAEKILKVKNSITETQAQELTNHQKQIGYLEDEIKKQEAVLAAKKKSANKIKEDNFKNFKIEQDSEKIQDSIRRHQETIQKLNAKQETGDLSIDDEKSLEFLKQRLVYLQQYKDKVLEIEATTDRKKQLTEEQAAREAIAQQELAQLERQQNIQNIVKGTTAILSTITTLQSIGNIFTSKDLSNWEKFKSIVSILAMQAPILVNSYSVFAPVVSKIAAAMGIKAAATTADAVATKADAAANADNAAKTGINTASQVVNTVSRGANTAATGAQTVASNVHTAALGAETAGTNALSVSTAILKAILGDTTGVTILAIAGIAAATLALGAFTFSMLDAADGEKQLAEELKDAQENLQNVREKYEEVKTTLSNYDTARDGLDNLTEGTLEFYDAILKVNGEAEKLIEKFGLIAGQDYTFDKNGLIKISEDTQEKLLFAEQQKMYRAQINVTDVKKRQADKKLEKIYKDFNSQLSKKENIDYRLLNDEQTQNLLEGKGFGKVAGKSWDGYSVLGRYRNAGGNLNDIMPEYISKYNAAKAERDNYFSMSQANRIRGYGSQQDVQTYNSMNETGQKIFNKALQVQDRQNKPAGSVGKQSVKGTDDFENMGFLDNPLGLRKAFTGVFSGVKYLFSNKTKRDLEQNAIETQGMQYFREHYAKNNGYKQKDGKWYKNGEEVDLRDEVSNETAVEYYNNTKVANTAENVQKLTEQYNKALKSASNRGFDEVSSKNIAANALAVQSGGMGNFDASMLDQTDRDELIRYLKEDVKVSNDTLNAVQVTLDSTVYNPTKKAIEELQIYNQILADQAEQIGTTKSSLEAYADAMRNAGAVGKELDETNADIIANAFKFNKVYNESVKVYNNSKDALKSYVKALKDTKVPSVEAAEAAGDMRDQLKQMGLNIKSIDLKDDSTFKNVQKLFEGTEEEAKKAYSELEKISLENSLADPLKAAIANATDVGDIASLTAFQSQMDDFVNYISNLSPGDPLDQKWTKSLLNMVNNAHMTEEEVEALFKGMNLEVPTPIVPEPNTENVPTPEVDTKPVPGNATRHYAKGYYPDPQDPTKTIPIDYYWDEWTDEGQVSYVKYDPKQQLKYTGGGKSSGGFAKNPSNTKSKKSGSTAKPSKKDPNKDQLDRYQKVNVQLKEIGKQLSALDKQKKKLLGGDLVRNLNDQVALLDKQIDVTREKLKIAQGEQSEVAGDLSKYGIKFDSDGNITNYQQIFKQEQNKLNAVYAKFNGMSKAAQESYQDVVKAAEENWKTFKDSISKYDNLIGETIPGLYQEIQDAYDKQTENLIEQFNMEIKIRLDMAEATRDWNDFKRKVIDGIKDDDILGTARARLRDFSTYYNDENTGEVQKLTERVRAQLEEIRKQEEENGGEWYRDNNAQAFEDLKEYYEKLKEGLTDIVELEEEMHQKFLDSMDEAQDKFDEQVDTFENINKHLDHNIELINLLTDQNDYDRLAEQYAAQTKNRQEELNFYTQQKDFWENYLNTLKEGTEEWENAKAKYNEAAEAWASALETTIQAARTEFENNLNAIFKAINNQLTNNKGLDYINEEWELISANSELALDNINRMQGIQEITRKYNDAINGTSSVKAQQKLAELRDKELESLKAMGHLSEQDLERAEKKLDIVKAQIALEDAQRNKSQMRLRRDTQGNYRYQFVADEDEINQAQQNLYAAYNELYNFDKTRYINNLNEAAKAWQEYQEKMAEAALINDPEVRAEKEALIKEQYNEKIGILHEQLQRTMSELNESTFAELNALYAENEANYDLMTEEQKAALNDFNSANQTAFDLVFDLYTDNTEKFHNMAQDQIDVIENQMVPHWVSGYQALVEAIEGEGGIEEVSNRMMDEIQTAIDKYNNSLAETQVNAGNTFEAISSAQSEVIENTQKMLTGNEELINKYRDMINEMKALYCGEDGESGLVGMMNQFKTAADQAKTAAEEAYNKIHQMSEEQAKAAGKNVNDGAKPESDGSGGGDKGGGNNGGNQPNSAPDVGSTITLPTGTYFRRADGSTYRNPSIQGRQVKILSNTGNLWKVYNSELTPKEVYIKKSDIGYDTGGYTGEWGDDGRLALLHQKELVLNKEDTANMLNAVEIMRGITNSMGADVLGRMAGLSSGNLNTAVGGSAMEQNVHIEATFPGVQSSVEIQDALTNLVNAAAQRALTR